MIAIPILVLVATFIIGAFWGIGICVIIDFVPSLKSRASTMQSSDSATQEQARRLRKKLQRVRLSTSPLVDSSSLSGLDAATARNRLRMGLKDPHTKPRYASTSLIEDAKMNQQESYMKPAATATVIMEPIPKAQMNRQQQARNDDDVFESENGHALAPPDGDNNPSSSGSSTAKQSDNRNKSYDDKLHYLTTGGPMHNYSDYSTSYKTRLVMPTPQVMHGSQPNLSKKHDPGKMSDMHDRPNSSDELYDNCREYRPRYYNKKSDENNLVKPTTVQRKLEDLNSRYYTENTSDRVERTRERPFPYQHYSDEERTMNRHAMREENHALLESRNRKNYYTGDRRNSSPINEICRHCNSHACEHTYQYTNHTGGFKRAESLPCQHMSPDHRLLRNKIIQRQFSLDDTHEDEIPNSPRDPRYNNSLHNFPESNGTPYKIRKLYNTYEYRPHNDSEFLKSRFRPVKAHETTPSEHEHKYRLGDNNNSPSCRECGHITTKFNTNYSPAISRSSEDTKLSDLYLIRNETSPIDQITPADVISIKNSPKVTVKSQMYPRSSSSSSSASSTSSRYPSKRHQHLEDIQEIAMDGRVGLEGDSTLDSRDLNSMGEDSEIIKSDSISPLSVNSMYTNHTPASTPPSSITTYSDKYTNSHMKVIRQESEC